MPAGNIRHNPDNKTLCYPFVDLVKINLYRQCVNNLCRKKVDPQISSDKVTCSNAACTVKPLNSGRLRVLKNLSVIERCLLLGGNFKKIVTFETKCFVRYSWYFCYLGCPLLRGFTVGEKCLLKDVKKLLM